MAQKQPFHPHDKYRSYPQVDLTSREWPNKVLTHAPRWCSVDLRDGNQALINPMTFDQKLDLFKVLLEIGFKEIEIGFPSASEVEYRFTRELLERQLIPDDVFPQVLVQARKSLLEKTFEAVDGYKKVIYHIYNPTSELQRRVVFKQDKKSIIEIATTAVSFAKEQAHRRKETEFILEYTPESFTGTELDFSVEICAAVCQAWGASKEKKIILNLPATVELSSPNIHADQIEWFIKNFPYPENVVISLHTHNDRGTGVAATELALLAGAERVEGTLFGNGERTGNLDIVTTALNLYTQGVDPKLDFSDISKIGSVYTRCTGMKIHPRHPYAGELVYTAFSGSHQDAIKKGIDAIKSSTSNLWEVPYLPIDPNDLGRSYEAIIRINSQSGKGGIAYIMDAQFGISLPKQMHPEFGSVIQKISDDQGIEIQPDAIFAAFKKEYLEATTPFLLEHFKTQAEDDYELISLTLKTFEETKTISGKGKGPLEAACKALIDAHLIEAIDITYYSQGALASGADSEAITFIEISTQDKKTFGVGIHQNTTKASLLALLSAVNRLL
jgi:2-isopropylmalate synthase